MDFSRSIHAYAHSNDIANIKKHIHQVNLVDSYGYTPLHYAVKKGHLEATELLLNNGAYVNATTCQGGVSVLHRAILGGNVAVVQLILKHGADVNAEDRDGRTVKDVALGTPLQSLFE